MNDLNDVNNMEQEAKYKIIRMEDEDASVQNTAVFQECKASIQKLYEDFREWWDVNQNSEETKERKEKLRLETERILNACKFQINKWKENEDLKKAVDKGVDVAVKTGDWMMKTFQEGVDTMKKNEQCQKVGEKFQQLKEDERVKKGVASFKRGTLKVAESAFEGLKKVLDDKVKETDN